MVKPESCGADWTRGTSEFSKMYVGKSLRVCSFFSGYM